MRVRTVGARLTVAGCALLALSGCGGGTLDTLRDDPMATASVAGLVEVERREETGSGGGLLGKPAPAQVLRVFEVRSRAELPRVVDDVHAVAEDAGWRAPAPPDGRSFVAERVVDGRPARLTVSVISDPDRGPVPGLSISLSATAD